MRIIAIIMLTLPLVSFINTAPNCEMMHEGTFKYLDVPGDPNAYIEIKRGRHYEYHSNGKYEVKSKIDWINDCTYELDFRKSDNPEIDFDRGTTMRVTIEDTKGKIIYYKATMNGKTWRGKLKKTS